jgi:hypothetical protein
MAKKALYSLGFYSVSMAPHIFYAQFSLANALAIAIGVSVFMPLVRLAPAVVILYGLCFMKWITIVVYNADHNVDRYESVLVMLLAPLVVAGVVLIWRFNRVIPIVLACSLLLFDYWRVMPSLGSFRFAAEPVLFSQSYRTLRRTLVESTRKHKLAWNLREDTAEWRDGDAIAIVPGQPPVYQILKADSGGSVHSPPLDIEAAVIREIVIRAGFTGWSHVAHLTIWRKELRAPTWIQFPVDSSGAVHDYRIPVFRNGDWLGRIVRIDVGYSAGDEIKLDQFRLTPYSDVAEALRQPSS